MLCFSRNENHLSLYVSRFGCKVTGVGGPRPLCVSLVAPGGGLAVALDAPDADAHRALSEGLALLVTRAHRRARSLLVPHFRRARHTHRRVALATAFASFLRFLSDSRVDALASPPIPRS